MAIKAQKDEQATLQQINDWLIQNFLFFRGEYIGWKNSVRHNLSLNDCFVKVTLFELIRKIIEDYTVVCTACTKQVRPDLKFKPNRLSYPFFVYSRRLIGIELRHFLRVRNQNNPSWTCMIFIPTDLEHRYQYSMDKSHHMHQIVHFDKTSFCTFYLDWSYITCDIIYDWGHHFVVSKWRTGDDCNLFETVYKLESKVYCSFIALHNNVRLNNPDLWFPHLLNLYDQNDQTDSNNRSHIYPEQLHFRMVSTPEVMKLQDEIPINDGQIW